MALQHFLLKIGFLDLTSKRMNGFIRESNEKMILWAFENGLFNIRGLAVNYFVSNPTSHSRAVLEIAMHDEIEVISHAAMSGLEKLGASPELELEIVNKRQFWKDENAYREGRRNREHLKESPMTKSKERGSKKSLDNARNMLKKPMLGGKWF